MADNAPVVLSTREVVGIENRCGGLNSCSCRPTLRHARLQDRSGSSVIDAVLSGYDKRATSDTQRRTRAQLYRRSVYAHAC